MSLDVYFCWLYFYYTEANSRGIPSKYQISNKIISNHCCSMTKIQMYHNPFGEYAV